MSIYEKIIKLREKEQDNEFSLFGTWKDKVIFTCNDARNAIVFNKDLFINDTINEEKDLKKLKLAYDYIETLKGVLNKDKTFYSKGEIKEKMKSIFEKDKRSFKVVTSLFPFFGNKLTFNYVIDSHNVYTHLLEDEHQNILYSVIRIYEEVSND